jgi:hypothetical protein
MDIAQNVSLHMKQAELYSSLMGEEGDLRCSVVPCAEGVKWRDNREIKLDIHCSK